MSGSTSAITVVDKRPWEYRWKIIRPLSSGGQGHTHLVKDDQHSTEAVLKELRNNKSQQARARMAKEVINLRILYQAGAKVPQILDHNTQRFEDLVHRLFFVMEHIEGDELSTIVAKDSGLPLDISLALVGDLCQTIKRGISEGIHHRDLKPENIIVRSVEPVDVVIVDYGLSFNEEEDTGLTKNSETIESPFLTLQERRIPGGDRRDPRSDLAAVCGILYYCVTALPPALLHPAPHRRAGGSVREKLDDEIQAAALESFLDRGLAADPNDRFQSIDELVQRLDEVVRPLAQKPLMKPSEYAKELDREILQSDRASQLARFAEHANRVVNVITSEANKWGAVITPFGFTRVSPNDRLKPPLQVPSDLDPVSITPLRFDVSHQAHPFVQGFVYRVFARGGECGLFRISLSGPGNNSQTGAIVQVGEWENVFWWNGLSTPSDQVAADDFQASLNNAMATIKRAIDAIDA